MNRTTDETVIALFEPDRFRSTVPYYVAHRPRYPRGLLELVLAQVGLRQGARVLDLGCGPGFLALGFAELGCKSIGIDPNAEMIAAACQAADVAGLDVEFRLGSSYDLDALSDRFDLAVMGRSFHWMDRAATLISLDRIIAPGGAVVMFYDHHMRCSENAFESVAEKVRETFGERNPIHSARKSNKLLPDEALFLDSHFSALVRLGIVERRALDADAIVGRAFSLSVTSPEMLGDRVLAFESELRAGLAELRPDGRFTEIIEFNALIATRSTPVRGRCGR